MSDRGMSTYGPHVFLEVQWNAPREDARALLAPPFPVRKLRQFMGSLHLASQFVAIIWKCTHRISPQYPLNARACGLRHYLRLRHHYVIICRNEAIMKQIGVKTLRGVLYECRTVRSCGYVVVDLQLLDVRLSYSDDGDWISRCRCGVRPCRPTNVRQHA